MRKKGREKKGRKGEKGVALVLTLLILTLLVVTGLELNRAVRVEATLAGNFRDLTQAGYIAQSGAEVARALLQNDDLSYDGLDERWAQFETLSFLSSQYFPEGYFTGRITDENGKLNPNGLIDSNGNVNLKKREQLERLLALLGHPTDWIEALLDWMDTDDQPRVRGAEREYYLSLKKPYPAKNGPLDSVEELLLVKGVEPAILYGKEGREGLGNYLTVNSDGKININTASLPVLMSLSAKVDHPMAQAVLAYRREKPFKRTEDLRSIPGWDPVYPLISSEIAVRSNYFSVEVLGNYREARSIVQTVIRRDGRRTKVLFWKAG
jgi:general secretion pathway protein K